MLFPLSRKRQKEKSTKEDLPALCPYCGEILTQRPKRKKKCPFCKNAIYVRTDLETGQKILTTEERAQVIDWRQWLESFGITKRDFLSEEGKLAKKFRAEPTDRDVIWALFNSLLLQYEQISDFHTPQVIYRNMAIFVEEDGKDPLHLLQQASRMELIDLKQSGCAKVKTTTANDDYVCTSCRNLEEQAFDIDDALEVMPLPNRDCTTDLEYGSRGRCRCGYVCVEVFGVSLASSRPTSPRRSGRHME